MATTKVINDVIDLNQTGNTTALKGCVGTTAQQPTGVEGMLRTNTDLSSASSTSAMQFYKTTGDPTTSGWVTLTNFTTLDQCNYPTTATALYQLDGNANDTCGNYNGTASNMTWTTGKFGECGVFNGTNGASGSRILLSNDVDQYPMSVSCWIYLDAVQASSNGAIVFEGQQGMGINFTGGNPTYLSTQSQNSQTGQVDSNSTLNTGQWYFVVGIFNSSSSS